MADTVDAALGARDDTFALTPDAGSESYGFKKPDTSPDFNKMFEESMRRSDKEEAARRTDEAPYQRRLLESLDKSAPALPKQEKIPKPPTQNIQQDVNGFLTSAMIIGALGGLVGRAHATNAMNAFAGAVDGYKQGRQDDYNNKVKQWETEVKRLKENNSQEIARYKAIFENRKLDVSQKQMALQTVAMEHQNRAMYEAARTKDILHAAQVYQQLNYHNEQLGLQTERLKLAQEQLSLKREQMQMGRFGETELRQRVERFITGDNTVFTGLGRGAQGAENLAAFERMLGVVSNEKGLSQEQIVRNRQNFQALSAGLRSSYQQEARMGMSINELAQNIPLAKQSMANLGRGASEVGSLRWNQFFQLVETESQDPKLRDLAVKINGVLGPYALVLSRGGASTVDTRAEAHKLLATTDSPEAFNAALDAMQQEVERAIKAPGMTREQMKGGETPGLSKPTTPPDDAGWVEIEPGVKVRRP